MRSSCKFTAQSKFVNPLRFAICPNKTINSIWSSSFDLNRQYCGTFEYYHTLSLLYIILALGALFSPHQQAYSNDAHEYYHLAKVALGFVPPIQETTLIAIQAIVSAVSVTIYRCRLSCSYEFSHWLLICLVFSSLGSHGALSWAQWHGCRDQQSAWVCLDVYRSGRAIRTKGGYSVVVFSVPHFWLQQLFAQCVG